MPRLVCSWYAENKRQLPWRRDRDPYRVWVSEIMLQQTRVEAAKPYFERFITELPDAAALADCPEDKLLKLWEGLGYYSRVRNMQKAARIIVRDRKGKLPADPKELTALPGIGSYTAGAIASIAYGFRVPAVDGNVLRILARYTADGRNVLNAAVKKEAEASLTEVLQDWPEPGEFNQGLMDLGASVCLPNAQPQCGVCPLRGFCEAHRLGKEKEFPFRAKTKDRRVEKRTVLLVRDGETAALVRRPEKGLLAGMYEFPSLSGSCSRKEALLAVEEQGLEPLRSRKLEPAKHLFSHVEWQMTGYEIRVAGFPGNADAADQRPVSPWILAEIDEIEREYPIPSAYKKYAEHIRLHLGKEKGQHD